MTSQGPHCCHWIVCALLVLRPILARGDDSWKVKADPPTSKPSKPTSKDFAIPFPKGAGDAGDVLYPTSPSVFVAIGKNGMDLELRQVWDLSSRKLVGAVRGRIGFDEKILALSPDGVYLAGKPTFRKTIEVYSTKSGKLVKAIEADIPYLDYVDFASRDRVVVGRPQDKKLQVHDIKSGDKVYEINLAKPVEHHAIGLSPGRNYLAGASNDDLLRIYDLKDGSLAAEAQTFQKRGGGQCVGLAFSPDGSELAELFEHFGSYRIICWSVSEGKIVADHELEKEVKKPVFYEASGLDWLPDASAFLVFGNAIVDRASGKKVWTLPFDDQNLKPGPRKFLDNEHALVITHQPARALRTADIPRDKIVGAAEAVRAGGTASDASLPPLSKADTEGAKILSFGKPAGWSVVPKGLAPMTRRLTDRPITLKGRAEDMRALLFPGGNSTQVIVVGTPKQVGEQFGTEGRARWIERYDLDGGRALGKVDLPTVVDPIGVSPEGARLLLREARAKDRLDVVSTIDAKPVAGWRPYDKESGEGREVAWAAFFDADRVLTVSRRGTLALWSLPKCKAVYMAEAAFEGSPVLSPDRSLVAGFDGKGLRVIEAETGLVKGEGQGPPNLGPKPFLKDVAFRPDGQEFAAIFHDSNLVRWDLKTGKIASQFVLDPPIYATSLEWSGHGHVLINNRNLVDLTSKRHVWEFVGSEVGARGPDGRHWLVARAVLGKEAGRLAAIEVPGPWIERAEALAIDSRFPAMLRPGTSVALQFNGNAPPATRQEVTDALTARLQKSGLTVADANQPGNATVARVVVNVREQDTGKTTEVRKGGRGSNEVKTIRLVSLVCEIALADASGSVAWMAPQTFPMQLMGFGIRRTGNETDLEAALKKQQWERVKTWAAGIDLLYFVARDGNEVVRLPGWSDPSAYVGR